MGATIIAISGKSGCGNTTVSKLVSEALGWRLVNYTFRSLAQEKGMALEEVLALAESDVSWDRTIDTKQVELARSGDCVIGSRLAIWLLPDAALKVYLKASPATRVERIHEREGGDKSAIAQFTRERDAKDHKRYLETYGIDTDDISHANLVIDTELWDAPEIAQLIVSAFRSRRVE
ncbi:MAG TPA: cytidylate kinase family protein [Spirochaetales bacterium]|nr:cytidylate kinase family protein [Spirochaetales bacterium]